MTDHTDPSPHPSPDPDMHDGDSWQATTAGTRAGPERTTSPPTPSRWSAAERLARAFGTVHADSVGTDGRAPT